MNTRITKAIFFIGSILIAFSSNAQTRYWDMVITTKGDTIHCNIDPEPLFGKTKYIGPGMKKGVVIDTTTVKEYFTTGFTRHSKAVYVPVLKHTVFLGVAEQGQINLYYLNISYPNGTSSRELFVTKGNDQLFHVKEPGLYDNYGSKTDKYKADFAAILKDNPDAYAMYMAQKKFNDEQIKALIHFYNTGKELRGGGG
ncbi:MAG TPA: hypothetical protein VIM55_16315 [Mucilaginibacter sp.]